MAIPVYFGIQTFGRLEDGRSGYVATRFFHIYYLPLIPVSGVRGTVDENGASREVACALEPGSVAISYFKWLGTVALAALTAVAYNELAVPPGMLGFVLALVSFALFVALIASWVWVGRRVVSARSKIAAVAVPVVLLGGIFGHAAAERSHRASLPSYLYALQQKEYAREHPGSGALAFALDRLRAVAMQQHAITSPQTQRCDPSRIHTGHYEGRDLMGVDGEYLDRWLVANDGQAAPRRPWLVAPTLLELQAKDERHSTLFELAEHPYLAVYRIQDDGRKADGWIHIFALSSGERLCSVRLQTDHLASDEFFKDAGKAIDEITDEVHLDSNNGHTN